MRKQTAILAAVMLCSLWGAGSQATTLLKLEMKDLVAMSEDIVVGQVTKVEGREVEGRIFTFVTLEASEYLKGTGEREVTVRVLGGRVGEIVTLVHSTPSFVPGEEVMVFLERPHQEGPLVVTGMAQGKFNVTTGPGPGVRYVVPDRGGKVSLVSPVQVKTEGDKVAKRLGPAEPSEFQQHVRSLEAVRKQIRQLDEAR